MSGSRTKQALANLRAVVPGYIDAFICCASFEQRSLSIAKQLPADALGRVLVAQNVDRPDVIHESVRALHERFAGQVVDALVRSDDPVETADHLSSALDALALQHDGRVLVDISTFTHEQLLILLALLRTRPYARSIVFAYTGADQYMLGEPKWLSAGVSRIRSVLGYPGALQPSQSVHLLVLVGFELERAQRLVEEYEPAVVSLGYAEEKESISPQHFRTNQTFHRILSSRLGNVHSFTFSCRDAVATKEAITSHIKRFPGFGVVVAPLNTKVSTVGAALAAFDQPAIQLCYAQASRYNYAGYSTPSETFYVVDVPGFAGTSLKTS